MRKLFSFLVGIGIGATLGFALVALFSPVSGAQFRANLRRHVANAAAEASKAQAAKRHELETRLREIQKA
jgi:gas vesicle protein